MPAVTVEVLIVDHDDANSSYIAEILQEDPHQDYRVRRIDGIGRLDDLADPGGSAWSCSIWTNPDGPAPIVCGFCRRGCPEPPWWL